MKYSVKLKFNWMKITNYKSEVRSPGIQIFFLYALVTVLPSLAENFPEMAVKTWRTPFLTEFR